MTEQVQPHLRPIAFAATGLTLDLLYLLQKQYNMDLESILIVLCVVEASMRPFMSSPVIDHELLTVVHPPESIRGSITRLMISDKTGLPRETVRRKCNALIASGYLFLDEEDKLRVRPQFGDAGTNETLEAIHAAVRRYEATVSRFGLNI